VNTREYFQLTKIDDENGTAVYAAAYQGKMDTVKLLLMNAADPNLQGKGHHLI
jgi:ankyrin repeat protein